MDDFNSLSFNDAARKILIACDFGTTFSGLAWAQTSKHDFQEPIQEWPGAEGMTREKVPTTLKYLENGGKKWGYQIKELEEHHEWFKLDLDPLQSRIPSSLAARYPNESALPPIYNVPCETVVSDYLTCLRKNAEEVLHKKIPDVVLRTTPREWIITIPAMWSDSAKAKTRACAETAGMGSGSRLHIISEPEAAAMYSLHAMDPHNLKVGDTFVVCDAGGGTVDLISYTLSALKPVLRMKEAAPGTGSLCGSTFLNRIFTKMLRDRFADHPSWDDEVLQDALEVFDSKIKRSFAGDQGEEFFTVPLPGFAKNPALGIERAGKLRLSRREVTAIFDPVINEVISLIHGQIKMTKSNVRAILMVGGFGQNEYLKARVEAAVGKNIEVMKPINGWTAVVRGALMRGIDEVAPSLSYVRVEARCARKHYGMEAHYPFKHEIHNKSKRYWEDYTGEYRVLLMKWFIKKGDNVVENTPIKFEFFSTSRVSDGHPQAVTTVIKCSHDPYDTGAPMYPDSSDLQSLVKLTADLSSIPKSKLKQRKGRDGEWWYRLDYDIEMTCCSADTKYTLVYDGRRYATVTAEYV